MTLYNKSKEEIELNYINLKSYIKVAAKLGVSKTYVEKMLVGSKVVVPCGGRNRLSVNDYFFSTDTVESMYWAGYLAADGSIGFDGKSYYTINASTIDYGYLDKFKKAIMWEGKVKSYKRRDKNTVYSVSIGSKKMADDLKDRYNIVPNKSLTYEFPKRIVNHNFVNHFIRGYIDGDGGVRESNHSKVPQLYVYMCGTSDMITAIRDIIEENCRTVKNKKVKRDKTYSIKSGAKTHTGNYIYSIAYGGNGVASRIRDFLYKGATSDIWMSRKHYVFYKNSYCNSNDNNIKKSPVIGISIIGKSKIKFRSIKDAVKAGFSRCCITDCCRGRQKTHLGYTWVYNNE